MYMLLKERFESINIGMCIFYDEFFKFLNRNRLKVSNILYFCRYLMFNYGFFLCVCLGKCKGFVCFEICIV